MSISSSKSGKQQANSRRLQAELTCRLRMRHSKLSPSLLTACRLLSSALRHQVSEVRPAPHNPRRINTVLLSDATGTVELSISGGPQAAVAKLGRWLYVRNGHIDMVANGASSAHMRLIVDRWAVLEPVPLAEQPPADTQLNTQNNLSATEYEQIADATPAQ